MKTAQLEQNEKAIDEIILIISTKEAAIIGVALEEYSKAKPRRKDIKKLFNEYDSNVVVC